MPAKVLIVEDEDALVTLLSYNLEAGGYNVAVTRSGSDALMVIDEENPDLVILDWMLPGLTGIEICRQIRGRTKTKALPIIMLTARGEEGGPYPGLGNRRGRLCRQTFFGDRADGTGESPPAPFLARAHCRRPRGQWPEVGPQRASRDAVWPRGQSRTDGIPDSRTLHGKRRACAQPLTIAG